MIGKPGGSAAPECRAGRGIPAISGLALAIASLLLSFHAAALPSTSNLNDTYLELWAGGDSWTRASTIESFALNVTNYNGSLSLKQVNITLSSSGNHSVFGISSAPEVTGNASWQCSIFFHDEGGVNASLISCNTATENITQGGSINITFSGQAMSLASESAWNWSVTVLNETLAYSVSQNITSGIDGLAPRFFEYSDNKTIASGSDSVYVSVNVTDLNLNTSSVIIQVVNVNSGEAMSTPASSYVYYAASSVWNYNVTNVPLSGFPDGNYTLNVTAYDNVLNSNSSLATPASWFFYDAMAPSVTLAKPASNANVSSGPVQFNFTPYDTSGAFANCSLWMTDPAGGNWHLNSTNSSSIVSGQENEITVGLPDGNYTWNVICFDSVANSSFAAANSTFSVANRSNVMVLDISVPMNPSPYPDQTISSINVTVRNNGSEAVASLTWLELKLDYEDSACSTPSNTSYYGISSSSLPVGGQLSVYYNVTIGSAHGTYYVCAYADYNNTETDESDVNDNILTESFSTLLNVTLLNIVNITSTNNVTGSQARAGQNVSVYVNVTFYNGTQVTNLPVSNFSVYDVWLSGTAGRNENAAINSTSTYLAITSQNTSGYLLNYTVPSMRTYNYWDGEDGYQMRYAEHGSHQLAVQVTEGLTGRNHTGESDESPAIVNYTLTAPYITVSLSIFDDMDVDDTISKDVTYSNTGNENITEDLTAHVPDDESDDDGDIDVEHNLTSPITIQGLDASSSYLVEDVYFVADAAGTVNLTLNFSATHDGEIYWYARVFQVVVTEPGSGTPTTSPTTTTTTSYECTANATCASDKWCKNLACVALTCPDGYTATDHVCKFKNVYEVSIVSFEGEVKVLQGGNATSTLSVKNSGNTDLTVAVAAETGVASVNASASPASQLIKAGETKNFTVFFSAAVDTAIGKYDGSFKATTGFSAAKDSEGFVLTINPLPKAIAELKRSYENYTAIYDQLIADFNAVKGQLSGDNLTMLDAKINETMAIFASLKKAMEEEDYAQAAVYLSQLDALIDSARATMTQLGIEEGVGSIWNTLAVWIIAALVCVGAAGLLLYMVLPSRGYMHGKGYNPHGKDTVAKHKFRNVLSSLRRAVPKVGGGRRPATAEEIVRQYKLHYDGTYRKLESAYKQPEPGMSGKMKNVFKKK